MLAAVFLLVHLSLVVSDSDPSLPGSVLLQQQIRNQQQVLTQYHRSGDPKPELVDNQGVSPSVPMSRAVRDRMLVVFDEEPLVEKQKKKAFSPTALAAEREEMRARQRAILSPLTKAGVVRKIKRHFVDLVNVAVVEVRPESLKTLRGLPGVVAVFEDHQVQANLENSVPSTGVEGLWRRTDAHGLPVTGHGMLVAIVDTGIDYNHTDLGGGFGPGRKVVGGYDFVNNDNDPMDDNYHGTHVAATVAGNGRFRGMAPDAKLLALKVLDGQGRGYNSDLIAAFEYCLDPDGNPTTDDAPDVVNASIGGPGTPSDPTSQAVNALVASGVVVVVSAGNNGPGFSSIGTPGAARDAITVGAVDLEDQLASFSSRGPVDGAFVKPEISAPGIDIFAAMPGNTYGSLSGTSMASPHVAGAATLLRQLRPDWTPAQIKTRLMNGSRATSENVFGMGSGVLDVAAAVDLAFMVEPGLIFLGDAPLDSETWTLERSLEITNTQNSELSFQVSVPESLAAIRYELSLTNFSLAPGQTQSLTLTLNVDLQQLPFPQEAPFTFDQFLEVRAGDQLRQIQLSFRKAVQFTIESEDLLDFALLFKEQEDMQILDRIAPGRIQHGIAPGVYDIVVSLYPDFEVFPYNLFYLVYNDVVINDNLSLQVGRDQAVNKIGFDIHDMWGNRVAPGNLSQIDSLFVLQHQESAAHLLNQGGAAEIRTNDFDGGFEFELIQMFKIEDDYAIYRTGIHDDRIAGDQIHRFEIGSADKREIIMNVPPTEAETYHPTYSILRRIPVQLLDRILFVGVGVFPLGDAVNNRDHFPLATPTRMIEYSDYAQGQGFYFDQVNIRSAVTTTGRFPFPHHGQEIIESFESLLEAYDPDRFPVDESFVGAVVGPVIPKFAFEKSYGYLRVLRSQKGLFQDTQLNRITRGARATLIYDDGSIHEEDFFLDNFNTSFFGPGGGPIREFQLNYQIPIHNGPYGSRLHEGTLRIVFADPEGVAPDLPLVEQIQVHSNGNAADLVDPYAEITVDYLTGNSALREASLQFREHGFSDWRQLRTLVGTDNPGRLRLKLPDMAPDTEVDLRVFLEDEAGNQVEYLLNKALVVDPEIEFPSPTLAAVLLDRYDTDENAILTRSEVRDVEILELQDLGLRDLTGLTAFESLRELHLQGNQIRTLPRPDLFEELEVLNLADNHLDAFPPLFHNPSLRVLNLSRNRLPVDRCGDLYRFQHLGIESVNFDDQQGGNFTCADPNQTAAIADPRFEAALLRRTDLDGNGLISLGEAARAKYVTLDSEGITDLTGLEAFSGLEVFWVTRDPVSVVPALPDSLKRLAFDQTLVRELPDLSSLENLHELSLGNNQLTHVTGLNALTKLRYLNLLNNPLNGAPDLSGNPNLETFLIRGCGLEQWPDLSTNTKLRSIWASHNNFESLSPLLKTFNLEDLQVEYNFLSNDDCDEIQALENLVPNFTYNPTRTGNITCP